MTDQIITAAVGTSSDWALSTLVLAKGQLAYETDTHFLRIGDGQNLEQALPIAGQGVSTGSGTSGGAIIDDVDPPSSSTVWSSLQTQNQINTAVSGVSTANVSTLQTAVARVIPSGADATGVADSTASLTNWLAAAKAAGTEAYLPVGTYLSASGLKYDAKGAKVVGAGIGLSVINFSDNTNHLLTVGGGASGGKGGYVRDISLYGPTANPTPNGKAALCVSGMQYAGIERVEVKNADKGFEWINNNYGSYGLGLVAKYSTCNCGLNLPIGPQSGNDIPFYDCWISGQVRGVSISGGTSGFSFHGGQFGCGYAATGTADAIWVLGSDYDTPATTSACSAIAIRSVDMENWNDGYAIHTYAQVGVTFESAEFLATAATAGHYAAGILKMENANGSQISFRDCTAKGTFANTALASVAGKSTDFHLHEENWRVNTPTTIAGVSQAGGSTWMRSLAVQSGLVNGYSAITAKNSKARLELDGLVLVNNGGVPAYSTDDGTTLTGLGGTSSGSTNTPSATAVVYASSFPHGKPAASDPTNFIWVCDGVADQVEINAAISAVNAAGGGRVQLLGSTFTISASIALMTAVWLTGEGFGTILKPSTGFGAGMVTLYDSTTHLTRLSNMTIDGAGLAVTAGVSYSQSGGQVFTSTPNSNPDPAHVLDSLFIHAVGTATVAGHGIYLGGGNLRALKLTNIRIQACTGCGVWDDGSVDSHYENIDVGSSGANGPAVSLSSTAPVGVGFYMNGANNMLTACKAWYSRSVGFYNQSTRSGYTNCQAQDNYSHGFYDNYGKSSFTGCHADSNGQGAASAGFYLAATSAVVAGCLSYDRGGQSWQQAYGFQLTGFTYGRVVGCATYGNATGSLTGTAGTGSTVDIAADAGGK